jgi:hypothetical protein
MIPGKNASSAHKEGNFPSKKNAPSCTTKELEKLKKVVLQRLLENEKLIAEDIATKQRSARSAWGSLVLNRMREPLHYSN